VKTPRRSGNASRGTPEIVKLPFGYTATLHFEFPTYRCEWEPEVPRIRSPRARKKFLEAYWRARDEYLKMPVLTLDAGVDAIVRSKVSDPQPRS
jgi:hypothetical protein